jgi:hypothetical protein
LVSCLVWSPALLAQQEGPKPAQKQDPKPAEKKGDAEDRKRAQDREMERLQKRIQEAIRRARRGGGVARPAPVKPAKRDAVHEALVEVQRAISRAQREENLKAMQEELDRAEKALMKARQELWKKLRAQEARKEKEQTGGSESKPTSRPASGGPPTPGDSGQGR